MDSSRRRFKLQAVFGTALFSLFLYAGWVARWEPFYTHFYLFAWIPFLWVIDRALAARTGAGAFAHPEDLAWLLGLSTTFWLIFEVFNFRLHNWIYVGLPTGPWQRWPGYAFSFATVMPGILMVRALIDSYLPFPYRAATPNESNSKTPKQTDDSKDLKAELSAFCSLLSSVCYDPSAFRRDLKWQLLGLAMILLPMIWPQWFFPLIWGGVFFLLDPWVQRKGGHSLMADWKKTRWRRTGTLLAAGLVCGLFWEGCNFGAGGKWRYTLPYWGSGKVFEMPALGFLGFLPFSLEVHAFHQAAVLFWRQRSRLQRILLCSGAVLFWLAAFYGIDRWTAVEVITLWRG